MKRKFLYSIVVILLTSLLFTTVITASTEQEGATFSETEYYKAHLPLSSMPMTYEAFIQFPRNMNPSVSGGVIVGNYENNSVPCVNFEIFKNGNPRLFLIDGNKKSYSFVFDKVNVYTGKKLHLAITQNPAENTLICYINGEPIQEINAASPAAINLTSPVILGGDYRKGNANYFRGSISQFAMYYNIRSADQIKVDYTGKYGSNKLAGFYTVEKGKKILRSEGSSYMNFVHSDPWIEKEPAKDYAYSFAVVGDTQILTQKYPKRFQGNLRMDSR